MMLVMKNVVRWSTRLQSVLLTCVVLFFSLAGQAQTTGTISGVVTDKGGALVPKVQVSARNTASGEIRTAMTNAAGAYSFPALAPGDYELTFALQGFSTIAETATLNITEHIAVNTIMQVSDIKTTVEVSSREPMLQTENTTEGAIITGQNVAELPLATNNFTQLLALSPGVIAPLNDATGLGRGTQNVNVNGARTSSNSVYVNGVDAVNVHTNSAANNSFASNSVIIPPPDAIQEIKIQTALFDATTGRSGGSNTALITRSGANQFHGGIYEFFRNTIFNANSFFLNQQGQPRPELNQNQFGGSIDGPIRKDKLFFFFNYQGTRQINGYPGTTSVNMPQIPTDRSVASLGAFGNSLGKTSYNGPTIAANGSNLNPVAVALLNLKFANGNYVIPSPQTTNTKGANYVVSTPSTFNEDEYTGSVDYQISKSDKIAANILVAEQPQFRSVSSTRFIPGFGLYQDFKSRLYSVEETHIFSSNVVNDFHFGLNRALGHTGFQNQIPLASIGMSRFNSNDFPDIPELMFSGSFEMGYTVSTDQQDTENTWQYFDNVSWLKGKHNMNFGAEMRRYQDNYYSNDDMRGTLDFISFQNFLLGLSGAPTAQNGNGTGHSDIYEETVASGIVQRYDRIRDMAFFAQDSWKPRARLTINAGLRWEYIGLPTDIYGRNGAFDPRHYVAPTAAVPTSLGFVQAGNARNPVPGIAKVSNTLTDNVDHLNFSPRLGFAAQLNNRMVLRGGYGLFYDRLSNQLGLLESLSLPNYESSSALNTGGASTYFNTNGSLANPFPNLPTREQFPILPQLFAQNTASPSAPIGIFDIDPKLRTPYYQQFGVNIQTQLTRAFMLQIGYVGSRGLHLPVQTEADQALIASPSNPVNGVTTNNTGVTDTAAARAPWVGFSNSGFLYLQTEQQSNFNSLQTTLTERLGSATLLASYMYSKSLDTGSGTTDGTVFTTSSGDQTNPLQAYGPSDFDRTHHATLRFTQPIPTPRWSFARHGFGGRLFSGYQVAGTAVIQSGTPFEIDDAGGGAYYGTNTSRGNYVPGATTSQAIKHGRTEDRLIAYFNDGIYSTSTGTVTQNDTLTGASPVFATATNFYGNTGRNILRGPLQRDLDFSLLKNTPIHEGLILEFRAQAFNITNTPNFANPASDIGTSSTFGEITSTVGNPRILQFVLKLKY
jgi:Carboxypeptidase regulatory-like domain/TonB-dependent Receptor Plug Domain